MLPAALAALGRTTGHEAALRRAAAQCDVFESQGRHGRDNPPISDRRWGVPAALTDALVYRNVFELGPLIDVDAAKLEFQSGRSDERKGVFRGGM